MKKVLLLAASWLMILTGCQKEATMDTQSEDFVSVQVATALPAEFTRTPGDGTQVNRAVLQAYKVTEGTAVKYGTLEYASVSEKKASFNLQLPKNQNFKFVVWADKVDDATADIQTDNHYSLSNGLDAITLAGNYVGNDETRDAFYGAGTVNTSSENPSAQISLYRPFAQLNIFATDYASASPQPVKVRISSTDNNLVTGFNAETGELASATGQFSYESAILTGGEADQMTLDYLFAPADQQELLTFKVEFLDAGGSVIASRELSNIPIQKNYRTNVRGSFFGGTTTDIEVDIEATINPGFEEPDNEVTE